MDRHEMVARPLTEATGNAHRAMRQQKHSLTDTGRVPEDLTRRRVTRGVFVSQTRIIVAEWYQYGSPLQRAWTRCPSVSVKSVVA